MADVWSDLDRVIRGLASVSDIKAAAIVGTSEMATAQLGQGRFSQALIESEEGKLVSTGAGDEALVIALAYRDANLGLVLMALERASRKVDEILRRAQGK